MQTYSHLLINAVADRALKHRNVPNCTGALLVGGVLPDVPFFLLTLLGEIYYRLFASTPTGESPMVYMHFTLYFADPWWIAGHNVLHAPFVLAVLGTMGYFASRQGVHWGDILLWFALGAGLHTLLDVFTHAQDGPLLLFPFNWQWRVNSPISYWDPAYHGRIFASLEHALDLVMLGYLLYTWRRHRSRRPTA